MGIYDDTNKNPKNRAEFEKKSGKKIGFQFQKVQKNTTSENGLH